MKARAWIAVSAALGAVTLLWSLRTDDDSAEVAERRSASSEPDQVEPDAAPASQPPVREAAVSTDSADTTDASARAEFHERARSFFARAPALTEDERTREARRLESDLSKLEQAGGMSAGETFLLRAGLIQETVSDPTQRAAGLAALKDRYARETRRRVAEANARPDPTFELYKAREREIIAAVNAMDVIPHGLTREEYLRLRLQQERERLMGSSSP